MHFFRTVLISIVMLMGAGSIAHAGDAPARKFIPFAAYKTAQGGNTSAPHFLPLKSRSMGKFMPRAGNATAPAEDIPAPHEGKPEMMTKDQANQILSIFGSNE